jgi:hypothetical protein
MTRCPYCLALLSSEEAAEEPTEEDEDVAQAASAFATDFARISTEEIAKVGIQRTETTEDTPEFNTIHDELKKPKSN